MVWNVGLDSEGRARYTFHLFEDALDGAGAAGAGHLNVEVEAVLRHGDGGDEMLDLWTRGVSVI